MHANNADKLSDQHDLNPGIC